VSRKEVADAPNSSEVGGRDRAMLAAILGTLLVMFVVTAAFEVWRPDYFEEGMKHESFR
jgi:hypothetical protein